MRGEVKIRDLLGRAVYSAELSEIVQIDLSQEAGGLHILTVYDEDGKARLSLKVVKE